MMCVEHSTLAQYLAGTEHVGGVLTANYYYCIIVVGEEAAPEACALGISRTVVECEESKVAESGFRQVSSLCSDLCIVTGDLLLNLCV